MLETHSTKATTVGESNNAESGDGAPRRQGPNGGSGANLPTLR